MYQRSTSRSEGRDADKSSLTEGAVLTTYKPLRERQIRILRLLPGKGNEIISCRLVAVDIDSNPIYEAVSYAWGNASRTTRMKLNRKPCRRQQNLVECLSSLRYDEITRDLWVDALCINQADTTEKSAQINLMPQIYGSAARTLIWLGMDNHYYPPGQILDDIPGFSGDYNKVYLKTSKNPLTQRAYSDALKLLSHFAQNKHVHRDLNFLALSYGLFLIADFKWWCRVWVVQETLLSNSAHIVLGKAMLPWHTAYQGALNIIHHLATCCQHSDLPGHYEMNISEALTACAEVILSFQLVPRGASNELLANLWMFRNRLASINHDKIYGLLGLLSGGQSRIQPDYRTSFAELCRSVTLEDIRVSGNLNALRGSNENSSTLPSWSTEWSSLDYWAEERSRILAASYSQVHRASGSTLPRIIKYPADPKQEERRPIDDYIQVSGRVFDAVIDIGHRVARDLDPADAIWTFEDLLLSAKLSRQYLGGKDYVGGGSFSNAYWRTLMGGCLTPWPDIHNPLSSIRSSRDEDCDSSMRRIKASYFLAFALWCASESESPKSLNPGANANDISLLKDIPSSRRSTSNQRDIASMLARIPAVRNIRASVIRATSGRRMFVTAQGYLGLGPGSMKVGDSIAILLGGSTPFMLREDHTLSTGQQAWSLVGDCYVHGWMDGEMMRSEDTTKWDDLILV